MPMSFKCSRFSALFCTDVDTLILLLFTAIPSLITSLFQNEHYDCSSFFTLPLVMASHAICILTECLDAHGLGLPTIFLLISTVMQSCMPVQLYCIHGYAHTRYFLFSVCLMVVSG